VVSDGVPGVTREAEMWVRLGGQADGNVGIFWEVEHLNFPIVDFIEFG
jgi:hypothetical protein